MALFVLVKDHAPEEFCWHVGETLDYFKVDDVYRVQADGDELQWIKNKFSGIPMSTAKRVVSWYGDHAKFIANLLL